jgi:Flp pilus assembly protein TadD
MGKVGLARVKAKRGQYEEAAADLEKTAMISPDSGMMYYYLGMMHEAAGKMDKAALAYRKAIEKILEEKESKD